MGRSVRQLVDHPLAIVAELRPIFEYIEWDSATLGLFHELWKDGDEVVRTRLRELLLRMEEVAGPLASQIRALHDESFIWSPWDPHGGEKSGGGMEILAIGKVNNQLLSADCSH